jgi:RNA binding exosome subunit
MKLVNHIHCRVFANPEEDKEKIKRTFFSLLGYFPEEIAEEKILFSETNAKGFSQKIIVILEADLQKERHCNKFLKRLNDSLSGEDKTLLVEQVNRLDDNMNFFIRLDKQELLEGKYTLTDGGDCFHITLNIEAHPRRKDVAHKVVKSMFGTN